MIMRPGQQLLLPANPLFIWFSLFAALALNMLMNMGLWGRAAWVPDLLALALVFWGVHQPLRIGVGTAFFFGLAMDVHQGALLGQHALAYTALSYFAITIHRRLLWFPVPSQALQIMPLFLAAHAIEIAIRMIAGGLFPGVTEAGPATVLRAHVDAGDHALCAMATGDLADQLGPRVRGGVHGDLVSTGAQQALHLFDAGDAATHGERNETVLPEFVDGFEVWIVVRLVGDDVNQHQFIDLALVVDLDRRQHRADAAPAVEAHALDQPELLPQQGGNDAHLQHAGPSMKFLSSWKPARELFSGWNWVPHTWPRRTAAVTGTP